MPSGWKLQWDGAPSCVPRTPFYTVSFPGSGDLLPLKVRGTQIVYSAHRVLHRTALSKCSGPLMDRKSRPPAFPLCLCDALASEKEQLQKTLLAIPCHPRVLFLLRAKVPPSFSDYLFFASQGAPCPLKQCLFSNYSKNVHFCSDLREI